MDIKIRMVAFSLMVSIMLMMAGCQTTEKKEVAMGRYLEESVEIEKGLYENDIFLWQEKTGKLLAMGGKGAAKGYEMNDKGEWKEVQMSLCDALNKGPYSIDHITSVAYDRETGSIYAAVRGSGEKKESHILKLNQDQFEEIKINWKGKAPILIREFQVKNNNLYIVDNKNEVCVIDVATGEIKQTIGESIGQFTVTNNQLLGLNMSTQAMDIYDINSGQCLKSINGLFLSQFNKVINGEKEGEVYLITQSGIYYLAPEANTLEKIVEGDLCSLGDDSGVLEAIFYKGNIYAQLPKQKLVKYVYHKEVPTIPETQITICMMQDHKPVRQAIQIYKERHPEVYVRCEVMLNEEQAYWHEGEQEAIQKVNTELLTGTGADLYVLDRFPIETYIEKGALMDLTQWVEEMNKDHMLLENKMKGYQVGGKTYAVPLRCFPYFASGDQNIIGDDFNLEDLASYQKAHPNTKLMLPVVQGIRLEEMEGFWKDKLFNTNQEINQKEMTRFLSLLKALHCIDSDGWGSSMNGTDLLARGYHADLDFCRMPQEMQEIAFACDQFKQRLAATIEGKQTQAEGNMYIGINSTSEKKEAAKEILEIALSKERQKDCPQEGFSVRKDVLNEVFDPSNFSGKKFLYTKTYHDLGESEWDEFEGGYEKEMAYFKACLEQAELIRPLDRTIVSIIDQEATAYFNGTMGLEATVENISDKVNFYLAEKGE